MLTRFVAALALVLAPLCVCAAPLPVINATVYTTHGEFPLKVEVATSPDTREHGLMQRDRLAPYDGMLFIFPTDSDYDFWMKNTEIPLDMIFIDKDRAVVAIDARTRPYSLDRHHAGQPVRAVLELEGGRAAHAGIKLGDQVRYVLPPSLDIF